MFLPDGSIEIAVSAAVVATARGSLAGGVVGGQVGEASIRIPVLEAELIFTRTAEQVGPRTR